MSISPPSSCTLQNSPSNNVPKLCSLQSYPSPTHQCQFQLLLRTSTQFTSIGRSTIYSELRKRRWCITHNPNQGPLCTCRLVRAWGTLLRIDRDRIEALLLLLTWESRDMGKKRLWRHPATVPVVVPYAVQIEKDAITSNLGVMQAATAVTKLPVALSVMRCWIHEPVNSWDCLNAPCCHPWSGVCCLGPWIYIYINALWAYTHPHHVIMRSKIVRYLKGTRLGVSMECWAPSKQQ